SGLGRALSSKLGAQGVKLVLADIEDGPLDQAVSELQADGVDASAVVTDTSSWDAVQALRDAALDRHGAVHIVVNNAGVGFGGQLWEIELSDWEWVLGVNLMGVVYGVKAFTPLFVAQGEGHIVNTASMAGLVSAPLMGVYNVSKHGVVTLSETLAAELQMVGAEGVGVSVLCPGWVRTRIHEAGRNRPASAEPTSVETMDETMREFIAGVIAAGLDPADVAQMVVHAIKTQSFYVLTHPDWAHFVSERTDRIVAGQNPIVAALPSGPGDDEAPALEP
ncbi:MAG: SDR family NAD(P)-dependent oxidoreductase, partial [Aquihabitans sp.]